MRSLPLAHYLPRPRRADLVLVALLLAAILPALWLYRIPRATQLTIDDPAVLLPRAGLYTQEAFPDNAGFFSWTNGAGSLKLPNPGGPTRVAISLFSPSPAPLAVQLQAGTSAFHVTAGPQRRTYLLLLSPSSGERITLALESSRVRLNDRRLGVGVSDLALAGGGGAPWRVPLGLVLATIGGYALLRQAGRRPLAAGGVILVLQALVLWWQFSGGWRYAWLGTALPALGFASLAAVVIERWMVWTTQRHGDTETRRHKSQDQNSIRLPSSVFRLSADWLILTVLLVTALAVRLVFLAAPDPVGDLELSARRMSFLYSEGLAAANTGGGDYLPLRLYWLLGLSRLVSLLGGSFLEPLPAATLVLIKLPGLLADMATTALIYRWCRRWHAAPAAAALTALYALAPPVWINVAWWGQIDAVLMLALLGAMLLLERAGGRWSWLCWGIALLIKSQAIVFAPLLFISTLRRYGTRGLLRGAAWVSGLLLLACTPFVLVGQGAALAQAYVGSTDRFPRTTVAAYNLWFLALGGDSVRDTELLFGALSYRLAGLLLLSVAALLVCFALLRRSDQLARLESAAVLALAFFCFPTQIHERYLFLVLAFLLLRSAAAPWLLGPYLVLALTATLNILGTLRGFTPAIYDYIDASRLPLLLAVVNLLLLGVLMAHLLWASGRAGNKITR